MSTQAGRWQAAVVALLAAAAAYPVAVLFHPEPEPAAWPLAIALVAGVAARAGATPLSASDPDDEPARRAWWRRMAALALVGCAVDVLVRTLLRLAVGTSLDASLVDGATLAVGALVAAAWVGGHGLALRMQEALSHSLQPGNVRAVGRGLVMVGCGVLAAAGLARWDAPAGGWRSTSAGVAVLTYAAGALLAHLWLRRTSLLSGWQRTGREVDPAITRRWGAWTLALLGGAVAVVSLWWSPPAEPVRRAADEASANALRWLQEDVDWLTREDLTRPDTQVAGESAPPEGATALDEDRTVISVRTLLDWLLPPVTALPEDEPLPGDVQPGPRRAVTPQLLVAVALLITVAYAAQRRLRRSGSQRRPGGITRALAAWLARLVALLLGRSSARPAERADPDARAAVPAEHERRRPRRLRRPSTPRERVTYHYLRVLERAERQGLGRHPAHSPRQYARVLHPHLPDHTEAVDELTACFIEARYSQHPIDSDAAERSRQLSQTLRRALKDTSPPSREADQPRR